MLVKKFFNFLNNYHYNSIYNYSKKLNFKILIDIGFHQGEFFLRFLNDKKIRKFYCFEPNKILFDILKKKYKNKRKILLYDCALGDNKSLKKLFLSNLSYNSTISSFNKKSNYLKFKNLLIDDQENYKFMTVKQNTFDEIFKKINIEECFLKLDVEGYEYNVLKGATKKIKNVKYLLIEHQFSDQYKNNFEKIKNFLIKQKFIPDKSFYYPSLHYRDILFINKRYK